jgi:two-component system, LuxR family, response regulator FixJ
MAAPVARITLVEDDASLRGALAFALESEGYTVATYSAAEPLLTRPPPATDCLIVDLRLPDMDGLALIRCIRALEPRTPAILITTDPDRRVRRAAAAAGVEIVEKPLIGGELPQRIEAAIRHQ